MLGGVVEPVLQALALLVVLYVVLTFVQVWLASRRDGATSADAIARRPAFRSTTISGAVSQPRVASCAMSASCGTVGSTVVKPGKRRRRRRKASS